MTALSFILIAVKSWLMMKIVPFIFTMTLVITVLQIYLKSQFTVLLIFN